MKNTEWIVAIGSAALLGLAGVALADSGSAHAKAEAAREQEMKFEYVVASGETLASIAVKLSGNEQNWLLIARENDLDGIGKSDPLKSGTLLKIPANLRKS